MTEIMHQKHFDYYMSHAENQCQNDIVEMIWKAPQRKKFNKKIVELFEDCYKKTKYPDPDFLYDIHKKMGLGYKQIQGWFNNKRKRDANWRRNKKI